MNFSKALKTIKKNKFLTLLSLLFIVVIITLILVSTGRQNCLIVHIKDGVKQTCDCTGLEITVKSTTMAAEKRTVCIGQIQNRISY